MKACDSAINPRLSPRVPRNNLCLFVVQGFQQRTPPTRQDVAIRAILASGCHTLQVIPWRACTTNCPAITTTTWRLSCHTTRSSSAGFTMYTPCICELAPRQCIPLTANVYLAADTDPLTTNMLLIYKLNYAYANFRNLLW